MASELEQCAHPDCGCEAGYCMADRPIPSDPCRDALAELVAEVTKLRNRHWGALGKRGGARVGPATA
jgi:hypothetical protein